MSTYTMVMDKWLALSALVILILGGSWITVSFSHPVYWRHRATEFHTVKNFSLDTVNVKDHLVGVKYMHVAREPPTAVRDQVNIGLLQPDYQEGSLAQTADMDTATAKKEGRTGTDAKQLHVEHDIASDFQKDEANVASNQALSISPAFGLDTHDNRSHLLTKERIHRLLQEGMIMVTWANHHYLDFARSWVAQLRKIGITGYLIGAMDDDMLKDLVADGVNTWRINTSITKEDMGWGSKSFFEMGRVKIKLIKQFLDLDPTLTVIISDIDTSWMKNPIPYFARYPTADILTSTDEVTPTVLDDSLEQFPQSDGSFNIGIMMFWNSTKAFVEEWIKALENTGKWDQSAFNQIAHRGHLNSEPPLNLWRGYDNKLTFGILPCALFANGHTFFVQYKAKELGLDPYVAHATFQYSGTPGKRHRFRDSLLWEDPPEYFDHHKGFITYTNTIPDVLLIKAAEPLTGTVTHEMLDSHFALVNHQLLAVRAAMAVATITGRVLIMPPLLCQLDKDYSPLDGGNTIGSKFKKPFVCPMDHVFDLEEGWNKRRHEPDFGPHIEWRESSFLQNKRLTAEVNSSRVTVVPCQSGEDDCVYVNGSALTQARLKLGLKSGALSAALQQLADVKILDFGENMADVFGGFEVEEHKLRFERRLTNATSFMWGLPTEPSWIWYDLFWDQPHKDRFAREHFVFGRPYLRGDSMNDTFRK